MKRIILPAICLTLAFTSCQEELNVPPDPTPQALVPLEISTCTATLTKGLVKETQLPDGSSIGITIKDTYGYYSGDTEQVMDKMY